MSKKQEEREEVEATILRKTTKAAQVCFGDGVEKWLPFSQCSDDLKDYDIGDEVIFGVALWLIEEEELEDYVLD